MFDIFGVGGPAANRWSASCQDMTDEVQEEMDDRFVDVWSWLMW